MGLPRRLVEAWQNQHPLSRILILTWIQNPHLPGSTLCLRTVRLLAFERVPGATSATSACTLVRLEPPEFGFGAKIDRVESLRLTPHLSLWLVFIWRRISQLVSPQTEHVSLPRENADSAQLTKYV